METFNFGIILCLTTLSICSSQNYELERAVPDIIDTSFIEPNVTSKVIKEGDVIKLKCSKDHMQDEEGNISWVFKRCDGAKCNKALSIEGEKLCGLDSNKPCRPSLKIDKAKKEQSGLYICYLIDRPPKHGYTLSALLVNVYHLSVIGVSRDEPAFVESPKDMVAILGKKVGFSCRVKNSGQILLKWFKKLTTPGPPSTTVKYLNNTYLPLNFSYFEKKGNSEFQSLLLFNETQMSDAGVYVCGMIGDFGIKFKEAKLTVLPYEEIPSYIENEATVYKRNKWETLVSLGVLASISIFVCGWVLCCCCKLFNKRRTTPRPPLKPPRRLPPVTSDTSDYEQV